MPGAAQGLGEKGMNSTRYTTNRIGQSALEGSLRATDGFRNMNMKKISAANMKTNEAEGTGVMSSY